MGRGIKAGRVWSNCYHAYPAHAAFGGYKQSRIGRENHRMMLEHYQQTKNLLVSSSPKRLGFFQLDVARVGIGPRPFAGAWRRVLIAEPLEEGAARTTQAAPLHLGTLSQTAH